MVSVVLRCFAYRLSVTAGILFRVENSTFLPMIDEPLSGNGITGSWEQSPPRLVHVQPCRSPRRPCRHLLF